MTASKPIDAAARDGARRLVWIPTRGADSGHWIFARWFSDERDPDAMSKHRRKLMDAHGGYWSAHFSGGNPVRRPPTFYIDDLPNPEAGHE